MLLGSRQLCGQSQRRCHGSGATRHTIANITRLPAVPLVQRLCARRVDLGRAHSPHVDLEIARCRHNGHVLHMLDPCRLFEWACAHPSGGSKPDRRYSTGDTATGDGQTGRKCTESVSAESSPGSRDKSTDQSFLRRPMVIVLALVVGIEIAALDGGGGSWWCFGCSWQRLGCQVRPRSPMDMGAMIHRRWDQIRLWWDPCPGSRRRTLDIWTDFGCFGRMFHVVHPQTVPIPQHSPDEHQDAGDNKQDREDDEAGGGDRRDRVHGAGAARR